MSSDLNGGREGGGEGLTGNHKDRLGFLPASFSVDTGPGILSAGLKRPGRKVTSHLSVVPGLKESRAVLLPLLCAFLVWTGEDLSVPLP